MRDALMQIKPFLKWAGGKRQLLTEIEKHYPFCDEVITKYAEPFVGGGAVLFDILNKYNLEEIYISDINFELLNTYLVVRDNVDNLIEILSEMQNQFVSLDVDRRKEYYLKKRGRFNEMILLDDKSISTEKASLMIFLNRTCFNGLYRVNKKGLFNVPMGSYKNPLICDKQNLRLASEKLQNVIIACGDYRKSVDFIDDKTFVYLDPPYKPISDTAKFASYTKDGFSDKDQAKLKIFVDKIDKKGAKFLMSNSEPKIEGEGDFFDKLYCNYKIRRVDACRAINCKGDSRGKIGELLISNF